MKTIVLTGGGTTGHVSVNLTLIPHLLERGWNIHYIGSKGGIEETLIKKYNEVHYHAISTGKLRRYWSKENVKDMFRVGKGILQAKRILKKVKPNIVFSKGGFVSVPVVLAAKWSRIPIITHESDMTPGLANRIGLPFATKICYTFEDTKKHVPEEKGIFLGAVVRDELFKGSRDKGFELSGFSSRKPVILVTGGSQGAKSINDFVRDHLDELLQSFQIIHLCGKGKNERSLDGIEGYIQYEYVTDELPHLYAISDLVLTRAGSNTIFELLALRKPMILIPLPDTQSRGDQIQNADYFKRQGYAEVIKDENLKGKEAVELVKTTYANRYQYVDEMRKQAVQNPTEKLLSLIEEYKKK
ncbi:undecaprenyldiphospho-muramoylpentapeptide beta-N-acetylglucosaminyltransferase [Bacillus litorisediminis]|uniref:undecaprenyldiphospho-muramoylpentapeptide beta-N-acetylglucosaminyltransferase n=1 Tax=Bacillus litorisediminis TaxID=2922713 RepID=UPI001FAC7EBB|nr:undecaprenyldiphospho-muramoylpentapeptide beta-N-acetylglucosaminyltransferase [Bacillus litorisediminis]